MSVRIFDKGCAAFNPISVIEIQNGADVSDFGMVDVAAHHAVDPFAGRGPGDDLLIAGDKFDGILDRALELG